MDKAQINSARSLYYQCFGELLSFSFTHTKSAQRKLKECLALMRANAFDENLLKDFDTLLMLLERESAMSELAAEFDSIFIAPRGALGDTFSYLEEGFENSSALVCVKGILAKTKLRKNERKFKDNEDNIGFCFSLMSELLRENDELAKELFESVINASIDDFCQNLFIHENARIYKSVANLISYFIEFERLCMQIQKPQGLSAKKVRNDLSRSEILRRETNQKRRQLEKSQRIS